RIGIAAPMHFEHVAGCDLLGRLEGDLCLSSLDWREPQQDSPLFTTFDAPDFSSVCTRRVRSNTPLQALNVANDPVFIEFAQALALRLAKEAPEGLDAQIQHGYQLCFSREPSEHEARILSDYTNQQLQVWAANSDAAKRFATDELLAEIDQPEMAATLVSLARVLFNTDNFITRE
ncbi:MAG: DUF1553 domain-containing protein, partial [Verrucomicrobiota bacterium]